MRALAALTVAAALLGGCGDAGVPTSSAAEPAASTAADTAPPVDPLVEWCGSVDADFCVVGLGALVEYPGRRDCVFASSDLTLLYDCIAGSPEAVTTTRQPGADGGPTNQLIREWRLAAQSEIGRVLPLAHPDYLMSAGLVFEDPLELDETLAVARGLGFEISGAWMATPVCVDGYAALGMGEMPESVRYAYLDGAAEVVHREAELTADGSIITGRHIFDTAAAALLQASEALHRPGVLVKAVAIRVAPGRVEELVAHPRVEAARLFQGAPDAGLAPGDLGTQPPAC